MERYLNEHILTSHPRAPRPRAVPASVSSLAHHCIDPILLIVIEHLLEPVQIEAVPDVLLIDLAEELMVLEVAEPADPPVALLRAVRITL